MAKVPAYICRNRHGTYYFRLVLPSHARQYFPGHKRELRRSLKTDSRKVAICRARCYRVRVDEILGLLGNMAKKETIKVELITMLDLDFGDKKVGKIIIDEGSPEANAKAAKALLDQSTHVNTDSNRSDDLQGGPLLSEVIKLYVEDREDNKKWKEKTKLQYLDTLNLLIEVIGDKPIKSVQHENIRTFGSTLRKLPARRALIPIYKEKSIDQILQMENVPPMSSTTVRNHFSRLTAFYSWAHNNGYVPENYVNVLEMPSRNDDGPARRAFTTEELQVLFNGYLYKGEKPAGAHKWHKSRFWLPLLGLFSGARLSELAQLFEEDIQEVEGIWCFDFNDKVEKELKNVASRRLTPIHSTLIQMGFLEFVEDMKKAQNKKLFPELKKGPSGYGGSASKQFAGYRKKMGITCNPGEPRIVFHSFRNTVITNLAHQSVPEEHRSAVVGHATGKTVNGQVYTEAFPPSFTSPLVEKIQYDVDMSHISYDWYVRNRR